MRFLGHNPPYDIKSIARETLSGHTHLNGLKTLIWPDFTYYG